MIYTSSYQNAKVGHLISISGDGGKQVGFSGPRYRDLAPKLSFWQTWHQQIGKIPESVNNDFYIREYIRLVLSKLEIEKVLKDLGENPILLCYENPDQFCHRHIVAAWIELQTGVLVPEILFSENGLYEILDVENPTKERAKQLILNKSRIII